MAEALPTVTTSEGDEDPQFQGLLDVIFRFAAGDLSARGRVSGDNSSFDAVITGINILGEEIEAQLAENERVEDSLRAASLYTRTLIEASLDPLFTVDRNGAIMDVNGAASSATGVPRSSLIGSSFSEYFTDPDDATAAYRSTFDDQFVSNHPLVIVDRVGATTEVLFNGSVYYDEQGEVAGVLVVTRDVSDRRRAERAEDLANHDELTGLYNHRVFYSLLAEEIARADRFHRPVSVLMLDIDHFKRVNDVHGHQAGDRLLRGLSAVLTRKVRSIDRVCRYGGEEFTVILPETSSLPTRSMAERLRLAVALESFDIGEAASLNVTMSIGIATYPEQLSTLQDLVKAADLAMYCSKAEGRDRSTVFRSDLSEV
ncbi:MAG: diguanylate cyclase [Actinobacteria bacterium]|nr:diguanylate cyclase [Actinomycetota bacterium]